MFITHIDDEVIQFATQLMACKLLRKFHKDPISDSTMLRFREVSVATSRFLKNLDKWHLHAT